MSDEENPFDEDIEADQYCWLDQARPCDEKCVSFDDNMGDNRGPCLLVNAQRKSANALGVIAKNLRDLLGEDKKAEAEALRQRMQELPDPPKVTT
jgi:hypothetical protein